MSAEVYKRSVQDIQSQSRGKHPFTMQVTTFVLIVCAFFSATARGRSSFPEILIDADSESNAVDPSAVLSSGGVIPPDGTCHVEIPMTKRIRGHCVKLYGEARACAAENYIHPFHRDCL
ncbi:hypothetical protein AAG570_011941 [Ranatra chinensis]|uniref:Uncharacterized protein n=1 Tax=Ranatra chinensis TaxID=642074 RepID=A0ABD0YHC7_9HEMI